MKTIDDYTFAELSILPKSAWPIGISPKWMRKCEQNPQLIRDKYDSRCRRDGKTARKRRLGQ